MKQKLKNFGLEFIAAAIVTLGIGFVTFYLAEAVSFLSIFMGILGYLILKPAVDHYKKSLEDFFKED